MQYTMPIIILIKKQNKNKGNIFCKHQMITPNLKPIKLIKTLI